jgi:TPR repeat protein
VAWYKKAAAQNQPDALVALGDLYLDGAEGLKADPQEAFKYFQKAVEQGRIGALNSLGFLYEHGLGVARNPERAASCYQEAAMKGDPRGQMNLGRAYLDGAGVKMDLVEAYKWFILAQRNGEMTVEKYLRDFDSSDTLKPEEKEEAQRRAEEFSRSFAKSARNSAPPSR